MQQQQQPPAKQKRKVRVPRVVNGVETMVEIEVEEEAGGAVWGANDKHTLLNRHERRSTEISAAAGRTSAC